jgi:hypothetical protein
MSKNIKHCGGVLAFALVIASNATHAQLGTASGRGVLEHEAEGGKMTEVRFEPRYSFAYSEGSGAKKVTWIVLTEKAPPVAEWLAAKDGGAARRAWGVKEKAAFIAVKLDEKMDIDLYFISSGPGRYTTSMVSSWNGLKSLAIKLRSKTGKRLQGEFHGGNGYCMKDGVEGYCERKSDYTFDVALR